MEATRFGRRDAALGAVLPVLSALSLVGTVLAPHLATHNPLLLAAMSPRYPFLALAATHANVAAFAVVGFLRLTAADVPHFVLARRHGHRVRALAARWRWTAVADDVAGRLFQRFGLVLVVWSPTGKVLSIAGAAGVSGRRVAAADVAGTALQLAALYGLTRPFYEEFSCAFC